ncbi:MAG TPA: hypothetical protein VIF35_01625 [Streptosporangiaceae bacterium]
MSPSGTTCRERWSATANPAIPPSRATPLQAPSAARHWLVNPRRHAAHDPQDSAIGLTTTGWPGSKPLTPGPVWVTVPENSWPSTTWPAKIPGMAGACRSVPQMPAAPTPMSTSPPRACGSGRSSRAICASGVRTTACMTGRRPA